MNFSQTVLLVIIAWCLAMLGLWIKSGMQTTPILVQANTSLATGSNGTGASAIYNPVANKPEPTLLEKAHQFAYKNGITSFATIEWFQPQEALSREWATKMFIQFAKLIYGEGYFRHVNTFAKCDFKDKQDISKDLFQDVLEACYIGIINGEEGYFMPKSPLTHEQGNRIISKISWQESGTGSSLAITRWGLIELMFDRYTLFEKTMQGAN